VRVVAAAGGIFKTVDEPSKVETDFVANVGNVIPPF
jgi:hypothetical protein